MNVQGPGLAMAGRPVMPLHPDLPASRTGTPAGMPRQDRVELSPEAARLARPPALEDTAADSERTDTADVSAASRSALSPTDQRVIEALSQQDREVRRHEQAHFAAAGALARGGPRYTYRLGPDGKRYVVSGEVPIDTSPVPGDPQATLVKASRIRRAALAPTPPSGTDLAIASRAMTMAAQARQDLLELRFNDHSLPAPQLEVLTNLGAVAVSRLP